MIIPMNAANSPCLSKKGNDGHDDVVEGFYENLDLFARKSPHKKALYCASGVDASKRATYSSYTFHQLREAVDKYAAGLHFFRVSSGMRVLVLAKPSLDFAALFFSLNKIGAVPVVIDPGMGLSAMLSCIEKSRPEVMIGDPKAFLLKRAFSRYFKSVKITITTRKSVFSLGSILLQEMSMERGTWGEILHAGDDLGAILFTSGSTGTPKGVELKRRNMLAQKSAWNTAFNLDENDIDLVTFPIFLLVSISSGRTCVLPEIDFSKPGKADPYKLLQAIEDHAPTFCFASPVLWNNLSKYAVAKKVEIDCLSKVVSGGAPVPFSVLSRLSFIAPAAKIFTPYGATEALPISSITFSEIDTDTQKLSERGFGTCVGRPVEGVDIQIIKDTDETIYSWSNDMVLTANVVGEIIVKGAVVTEAYSDDVRATAKAKIYEYRGAFNGDCKLCWHRMGDLGYFDEEGRLWFCGRKTHKVIVGESVYYSVQVEGIFNALASVWRTALVANYQKGSGMAELTLAVELEPEESTSFSVIKESLDRLSKTYNIPIKHFLHHKAPFPVDRRHNAKIDRSQIARWAEKQI